VAHLERWAKLFPMKHTLKSVTIIGIFGLFAIAGVALRGQAGANQQPARDAKATVSSTSAYFIVLITIRDRAEFTKYTQGFRTVFSQYKGEVLVVDEEPLILEGEWPYTRTVVIRFPDAAEAKRWYQSKEYQELAQHRFRAGESKLILAKGRI
jgi:uncharacterized protein (DUF1330 family)